jgi:hypothetical protein
MTRADDQAAHLLAIKAYELDWAIWEATLSALIGTQAFKSC